MFNNERAQRLVRFCVSMLCNALGLKMMPQVSTLFSTLPWPPHIIFLFRISFINKVVLIIVAISQRVLVNTKEMNTWGLNYRWINEHSKHLQLLFIVLVHQCGDIRHIIELENSLNHEEIWQHKIWQDHISFQEVHDSLRFGALNSDLFQVSIRQIKRGFILRPHLMVLCSGESWKSFLLVNYRWPVHREQHWGWYQECLRPCGSALADTVLALITNFSQAEVAAHKALVLFLKSSLSPTHFVCRPSPLLSFLHRHPSPVLHEHLLNLGEHIVQLCSHSLGRSQLGEVMTRSSELDLEFLLWAISQRGYTCFHLE